MQKPLLLGLTIPFALVSTACEPTRIETLKPPAALTECADEPVAPSLPGRELQEQRDAMTLDYILALRSAYGDCKSKVAGLKAWVDGL